MRIYEKADDEISNSQYLILYYNTMITEDYEDYEDCEEQFRKFYLFKMEAVLFWLVSEFKRIDSS